MVSQRLENPNYGQWTLQTLFDIAQKLDKAVVVRFVDFPTFLKITGDFSDIAMNPMSYDQQAIDNLAARDTDASSSVMRGLASYGQIQSTSQPAANALETISGINIVTRSARPITASQSSLGSEMAA
jgi:hypothetical protein